MRFSALAVLIATGLAAFEVAHGFTLVYRDLWTAPHKSKHDFRASGTTLDFRNNAKHLKSKDEENLVGFRNAANDVS